VKVPDVLPCGIVMVEGTLAAAVLELESEIRAPPLPAGAVIVTVPVPVWPLAMVLGFTEMLLIAGGGGLMLMPKVLLTPE
jgi:hypothetical protein